MVKIEHHSWQDFIEHRCEFAGVASEESLSKQCESTVRHGPQIRRLLDLIQKMARPS
jgi:hypothetical protein